jgi:hypothetical protein
MPLKEQNGFVPVSGVFDGANPAIIEGLFSSNARLLSGIGQTF